jgi:pyruvate kinase
MPEALENIDKIVACDALMVARGDLGQLSVPLVQKELIRKAKMARVIVATQMMETMITI